MSIAINNYVKKPYGLPVEEDEIRSILFNLGEDLDELQSIQITPPKRNVEFGYFGRYDHENRTIYIFAHIIKENRYMIGRKGQLIFSSEELKEKVLEDTILHEIGHHVGWIRYKDLSENFANAYARSKRQQV